MASNSIGTIFKFTSFGESHGPAIGGVIDGCPAGVVIDQKLLTFQLNRRKPGQSALTTSRNENDEVEFLSGIFENITTGHPIAFIIKNNDARSDDYDHLKSVFRPSHADYTYKQKYGIRDHRGGGRSSARITAAWVVAGTIAQMFLKSVSQIETYAYVSSVHTVKLPEIPSILSYEIIESSDVRCPDPKTSALMVEAIQKAQTEKDSLGGIVSCIIKNCPVALGEPVFGKMSAMLAHAMFSINAVKAFELGDGFTMTEKKGSEMNDAFNMDNNRIGLVSNHSGGIQGGISNGADINFRVGFKPTATIGHDQNTVDDNGNEIILKAFGRHDTCVVPRAVPIVECMTYLVLADLFMQNRNTRI